MIRHFAHDVIGKKRLPILGAALLVLLAGQPIRAASLLDGLGGPKGFGTQSIFRNDDSGEGPVTLPFSVNFYGTVYDSFYVNTNGNITFRSVFPEFTPSFFPGAPQPIIAPWWADVDTRNPGTGDDGLVWYAIPDAETAVVTWNNVGVYNQLNPPTNNFQLVLRSLAGSTGNSGDFSFEFRYNDLQWTTGQASGGDSLGLGGIPAVAGFDSGNGIDYYTIPGSRTPGVLGLINVSNINQPGVWRFNVVNGEAQIPSAPGPLPILGATTALALSRRLRKRISCKAALNDR
jgi:hypothetical protein